MCHFFVQEFRSRDVVEVVAPIFIHFDLLSPGVSGPGSLLHCTVVPLVQYLYQAFHSHLSLSLHRRDIEAEYRGVGLQMLMVTGLLIRIFSG